MKKSFTIIPLFAAIIASLLSLQPVYAGGQPSWDATITPASGSAPADGHSTITLSIHAYTYYCSNPPGGNPISYPDPSECAAHGYGTAGPAYPAGYDYVDLIVSGVGTLASSEIEADANGNVTTTIKSTSVGSAIINAYWTTDHSMSRGSASVSFTTPPPVATPNPTPTPAAAPRTQSKTSPTPTTTRAPSVAPQVAPAGTTGAAPSTKPTAGATSGERPTLVQAMTGAGGLAVAAVIVLILLLLFLAKRKLLKLPFGR